MTRDQALDRILDGTGHLLASVLTSMSDTDKEAIARELESGEASILIRLTPASNVTVGTLETRAGYVELFRSEPTMI